MSILNKLVAVAMEDGGFGSLFLAKQKSGRRVALKFVSTS
jgi:hypothetical protein